MVCVQFCDAFWVSLKGESRGSYASLKGSCLSTPGRELHGRISMPSEFASDRDQHAFPRQRTTQSYDRDSNCEDHPSSLPLPRLRCPRIAFAQSQPRASSLASARVILSGLLDSVRDGSHLSLCSAEMALPPIDLPLPVLARIPLPIIQSNGECIWVDTGRLVCLSMMLPEYLWAHLTSMFPMLSSTCT